MPTPEDTSQTPDNPSFVSRPAPDGYRCAGAWIRLAALMIDGLVLFAKVVTRDGDLVMVGAVSGFEDQQGASASPRRRAAWSSGSLDGSWPSSRASHADDDNPSDHSVCWLRRRLQHRDPYPTDR
jgi:hypothetical protein